MPQLDQEKVTRLYSIFPDVALPSSVLPYGLLIKPLKLFILTCAKLGDPSKFTPMVTVKTAFELFVTSYLDEEFRLFDVFNEGDASRAMQKRRPLAYAERRNRGANRTVNLPLISFTTLLGALLASKDFVEAMAASVKQDFAEGRVTAAEHALFTEFLPKVKRLAGRGERHLVLFNFGLLPRSKPLPESFIRSMDPAGFMESAAALSGKYQPFNPADEFNKCLEPSEIENVNSVFIKMERTSALLAKKISRNWNARRSDLVLDGVLNHKDERFINEKRLDAERKRRGVMGIDQEVDTASS